MKTIHFFILTGLILACTASSAQTFNEIYSQNQKAREDAWKDKDDRGVKLGIFAHYFLTPLAQFQNKTAFDFAMGGGLKLFVPAFTSGGGTNGDDLIGDFTLSAGYTNWSGSVDNSFPDLNAYTGMLGFRLGLFDILSVEPQAGYSYGTYSTASYKYPASSVSGLSYALHVGLTLLHGLDVYGTLQTTSTKTFGNPLDYGLGMELHF